MNRRHLYPYSSYLGEVLNSSHRASHKAQLIFDRFSHLHDHEKEACVLALIGEMLTLRAMLQSADFRHPRSPEPCRQSTTA
jgi:hypothetical protein